MKVQCPRQLRTMARWLLYEKLRHLAQRQETNILDLARAVSHFFV